MVSTQEEWRQQGTGAWLEGAEKRLLLETKALHTRKKGKREKKRKSSEKNDIHECKQKRFEHMELLAKLIDYFLQSNKININQNLRRRG